MTSVSVIIRAKDRAHTITDCISSVRSQSVESEIVVVDSGSTDGTVEIAQSLADTVVSIPAGSFTYGGALNAGAEAAQGSVHVALSAHCELPSDRWIEHVVALHDDPLVAGTSGETCDPHGTPITTHFRQTATDGSVSFPYWGYSNHAGSWSAAAWAEHPFDTELDASEDKEWSARVRRAGYVVVLDPRLNVGALHRRREGPLLLYRRAVREAAALRRADLAQPRSLTATARAFWTGVERHRPVARQRVNPFRLTEYAGRYVGEHFPGASRPVS